VDHDSDAALSRVGRVDGRAAVQRDLGEPLGAAAGVPRQEVSACQARDERVGGHRHEVLGRSDLEHAPAGEDADAVGERGSVLEVVRDQDRRQPELPQQLLELPAHRGSRVCVERGERLVEQQDSWVPRERAGEGGALAFAARQLAGPHVCERRDPESLEQLGGARLASERDVALHRQVREERIVLEDVADRPGFGRDVDPPRGIEPHVVSERDPARLRSQQPGDRAQEGRLAGARRPDERERPLPDLERQLEMEGAELVTEVETERVHPGTILSARRRAAPTRMKRAPIASAVSKSRSSSA